MPALDEKTRKLLEGKNYLFMATINKDGSPQLTPVWADVDGENVMVNTAIGRKKQRNVLRDPRVALSICDQGNPYLHASIEGKVVRQITGNKADDHIDKLAHKYMGTRKYGGRDPTEKRVILVIKPTRTY